MMRDYWGYNHGTDVWGFVFMLLIMALVVLAAVWAVRYLSQEWHHTHKNETPLDILEKRYSKGEIDKAEFDEKRKVLSK